MQIRCSAYGLEGLWWGGRAADGTHFVTALDERYDSTSGKSGRSSVPKSDRR